MKTSYFGNPRIREFFDRQDPKPPVISIAASTPDWFQARQYPALAPPWGILSLYKKGMIDKDRYEEMYFAQVLRNLDVHKVITELGHDAILLCWEKPGQFCHRQIVADWIRANSGVEIEEL